MTHTKLQAALLATAAAATLLLAGCGRNNEDRTVGQKVDTAIANAEQRGEQIKQDSQNAAERAKNAVENAADKASAKIDSATDKMAAKVEDATITASVNAELAKDSKLSALRINVDTVNGRVALNGTAPDSASRERATELALLVKGVTGVDNKLVIGG